MRSLLRRTGTWFRSGTAARQDCDETRPALLTPVVKLLIRPPPPTGPGPATASGQVAPRHKASHSVGHTRSHQLTAQHHQAANAILTDAPSRWGVSARCLPSRDRPTPVRAWEVQGISAKDRSQSDHLCRWSPRQGWSASWDARRHTNRWGVPWPGRQTSANAAVPLPVAGKGTARVLGGVRRFLRRCRRTGCGCRTSQDRGRPCSRWSGR
jgi:hypothetical protein